MIRNRIAIVALGLLLVAFQSASSATTSQEPLQDKPQVSSKGDAPVPDDAIFTPLRNTTDNDTSGLAQASEWPKAQGREPGRLLELQGAMKLPISAGTGGGDMSESEPNNVWTDADVAHDLPFQCTGEISYDSDYDFIRVDVTAGVPIEIDVFIDIGYLSSPLDPGLVVLDSSYNDIARNDDAPGGGTLSSQVNFVAPYTGPIYILVKGVGNTGGPGSTYIVSAWPSVTEVYESWESEPNDVGGQADPMVLPGVKCGTISTAGDVDMVWFEALGGSQIVVDLHSRAYGMTLDSVVELVDESGHTMFANDDADSMRDSRFNLIIPYTGHYFVRVRDYSGSGSAMHGYILSVSLQERANSPVISKLKFVGGAKLKKVTGYNFVPEGSWVEVVGVPVSTVWSAVHPTTVLKVKPRVAVPANHWITVVNDNGRRSNPYVMGTSLAAEPAW